jgi:hypothetical protein
VFCISSPGYAAPCYGTRLPEEKHILLGLQTYSVFKRPLENDYGKISSFQNFFLISYGVFDWLSIDLKGGAGNINQRPQTSADLKYPAFVGGGYGFRARLYDSDKTKIVFGFQHISIHPHTVSTGDSKHKVVLDNCQFSLLVSREFLHITPYLGASWSRMDNIHWINTVRKLEQSDSGKSTGLIIGADIPINKKTWFNLEGRFFDETSVAGSISFAF